MKYLAFLFSAVKFLYLELNLSGNSLIFICLSNTTFGLVDSSFSSLPSSSSKCLAVVRSCYALALMAVSLRMIMATAA